MALRHYQGSIGKPVGAVWKCPTCKAENTQPLEQGCPICGAGADAKPGTVPQASAERMTPMPPMQPLPAPQEPPNPHRAFVDWLHHVYPRGLDTAGYEIALAAWKAGYEAGYGEQPYRPPPMVPPKPLLDPHGPLAGGLALATYNPLTLTVDQLSDRAQATILAALRFYQENTLVYGPLEGQLTSDEVDQLLASLKDPYGTTDRETPEGETGTSETGPRGSSDDLDDPAWRAASGHDDGL
jgi:hypothetical protein